MKNFKLDLPKIMDDELNWATLYCHKYNPITREFKKEETDWYLIDSSHVFIKSFPAYPELPLGQLERANTYFIKGKGLKAEICLYSLIEDRDWAFEVLSYYLTDAIFRLQKEPNKTTNALVKDLTKHLSILPPVPMEKADNRQKMLTYDEELER